MRLALLGNPVAHSLSPRFQGAGLASLGLEGSYVARRVEPDALASTLASLRREGYRGVNLTVPLKEAAFALLEADAPFVDEDAAALRATNTLRREDEGWCLHNTDVTGAAAALSALLEGALTERRVLLLGAGGAARAVARACLLGGVRRLSVWNRSPDRVDLLRRVLGRDDPRIRPAALAGGRCPGGHDVVVQCTSLGLRATDDLPPLPASDERPAVLDLVTHATPWQARCRALGCAVADGREMLLAQGAASLTIWTGLPAPLDAMRAALAD